MREFSFRLWDNKKKKYVKDDFFVHNDGTPYKYGMFETMDELYDCVIEQYTGLKDKNGVEVYEGDILEPDGGNIKSVVWVTDDYESGFKLARKSECKTFNRYWPISGVEECYTVIGNFHENPELLNPTQNIG